MHTIRRHIYLSVGILILIFYIYKFDIVTIIRECEQYLNYSILLVLIPLMILTPIIRALRWKYVAARIVDIDLSFFMAFKLTSTSFFISCVTPFKIGDFSRAFFHARNRSDVMVGVSIEFFFDSLLLFLIPAFFFSITPRTLLVGVLSIIFLYMFFFGVFIKVNFNFLNRIKSFSKITLVIFRLQKSFRITSKEIIKKPRMAIVCFISSTLLYLNYYFCTYLIFKGLGLKIDLFTSMQGLSLSQALGTISMIPMGLGTREFVAINFFQHNSPLIFTGLLLSRLLVVFYLLIGFYFYITYTKNLKYLNN